MPAAINYGTCRVNEPRTGGIENLGAALNGEIEHAAGVLADTVFDAWCGNAVAVLQHRIERDLVVFFGKILGADADLHAVTDHAAEHIVMLLTPGQQAVGFGLHGLGADTDHADKLEVEAAQEAARAI